MVFQNLTRDDMVWRKVPAAAQRFLDYRDALMSWHDVMNVHNVRH